MGYQYLELEVAELAPEGDEETFRRTADRVRLAGIPAMAFRNLLPSSHKIVGPTVDSDRLHRYMLSAVARAKVLGGRVFVLGSGPARQIPDGYPKEQAVQQFVSFARMAADEAHRAGMAVAIEPISRTETNLLPTLAEAVNLVKAVNHPALGVMADSYHMHMEQEPFAGLLDTGGRLRHVQVCDVGRAYPGSRYLDLWGFFIFLNKLGYDGSVSVECNWTSFSTEGPRALEFVRGASRSDGSVGFRL